MWVLTHYPIQGETITISAKKDGAGSIYVKSGIQGYQYKKHKHQ